MYNRSQRTLDQNRYMYVSLSLVRCTMAPHQYRSVFKLFPGVTQQHCVYCYHHMIITNSGGGGCSCPVSPLDPQMFYIFQRIFLRHCGQGETHRVIWFSYWCGNTLEPLGQKEECLKMIERGPALPSLTSVPFEVPLNAPFKQDEIENKTHKLTR